MGFTGYSVTPATNFRLPSDLSPPLIAWNMDPAFAENTSNATSGTIYLARFVLRNAATITNLAFYQSVAATSVTADENFLMLVNSSGTIVGQTAAGAIDTAIASAGWTSQAMTATYAAPAGQYYVAMFFNVTGTAVGFGRATGQTLVGADPGLSAANYWFAVNGLLATAPPASFTLSSNTHTNAIACCVGVS
jgi:hypothetical protein